MPKLAVLAIGCTMVLTMPALAQSAGSLQGATTALGAANLKSIEYSGTGRWYQFGQAPGPELSWPPFDVSAFTATVSYEPASARIQMTRKQVVEPGRARPAPVDQRTDQHVSGTYAWNMAVPANSPAGTAPAAQPQPIAVEERTMEIWTTPQGFLKAAAANNAIYKPAGSGSEVSFTVGAKYRYIGTINAQNQVEKVQTWISDPVFGDTLVDLQYSGYKDFGGVMFPSRIVRIQGGHPVLDINVMAVKANPAVTIQAPDTVRSATVSVPPVTVEKLAEGVYFLAGSSHHSLAIDQKDHVVVVEGPQHEERAAAVIAKVKETIPNKPIRYVINTHAHSDHSGGLRTFVDEGAIVVTHKDNQAYYEKVWAAPRTLAPDRLAKSKKTAKFETMTDKHVLTDGSRTIEIHNIKGSGHSDAFVMVYLPAEKILVQGDAYNPLPANAPPPAIASPFNINLLENIERLKLDVARIAPIHGRLATVADLKRDIGRN